MQLFESWIDAVFDHAVSSYDRAWWWTGDAALRAAPPALHVAHLARLFEDPLLPLDGFADSQIAQGLHYLIDTGAGGQARFLVEPVAPLPDRLRGIAAIERLFALLFAPRCSPHLAHLDEAGPGPLNGICYMWWDIFPLAASPEPAERGAIDAAILGVLTATLGLESIACQEAALHGLGHWQGGRSLVAPVIDAFLARHAAARPELLAYARAARAGCVN